MIRINDELYLQYEKIMIENGMPQDLVFKTFKELLETNVFFNNQQQLQQEKQELIEWLEEEIKVAEKNQDFTFYYKKVLNKIKEKK